MKLSALLLAVFSLLLFACSAEEEAITETDTVTSTGDTRTSETLAPDHPDDLAPICSESCLEIVIDGQVQNFVSSSTTMVSDPVASTFTFCGQLDPIPDAIDDESTLCIALAYDPTRFARLAAGDRLELDMTTTIPLGDTDYAWGEPTFAPGPNHAAEIVGLSVTQQCYCFNYSERTQVFTGSLSLTQAFSTGFVGQLELHMQGGIPASGFDGPVSLVATGEISVRAM